MSQPRFFVDHGVIHDRVTGRHVFGSDREDPIGEAVTLLNSLCDVNKLVDRFLAWPVPTSCRPDNLDLDGRMRPGGSGTNLLSAAEAKQMFEFVLGNS